MRGEYDKKMQTDDPTAVVREFIQTQHVIIKDVHGREDAVPHTYYQLGGGVAKADLRTSGTVQGSTGTV
jgi:hypothetical protein